MPQPISAEAMIRSLEARVAKLERALHVSAQNVVLQVGQTQIALDILGNVQINATNSVNINSTGPTQIVSGSTVSIVTGLLCLNAEVLEQSQTGQTVSGTLSSSGNTW